MSRWELVDTARNGTFLLTPYKPVYLLPAVWSSSPNGSPNAVSRPNDPAMALDVVECKFQFSFKTKLLQGLYKKKGDVWVAYTQSSRWQVYNYGLSRSFRETNYEPEVMVVYPTNYRFLGFRGRLLSAGLNHQSNGGSDPLSRSWNRADRAGRFRTRPVHRAAEAVVAHTGTTGHRCQPVHHHSLGNAEAVVIFQLRSHVIALQARSAWSRRCSTADRCKATGPSPSAGT
ncbi:MAG: phospholipase A [Flavobacteriales bacterium]|nr:phospholipase A [Flavobacteriales bacterium]